DDSPEMEKERANAHLSLAALMAEAQGPGEALSRFRAAVRLIEAAHRRPSPPAWAAPLLVQARAGLAGALGRGGQIDEARREVGNLLAAAKRPASAGASEEERAEVVHALVRSGGAWLRRGRPDEAGRILDEAERLGRDAIRARKDSLAARRALTAVLLDALELRIEGDRAKGARACHREITALFDSLPVAARSVTD